MPPSVRLVNVTPPPPNDPAAPLLHGLSVQAGAGILLAASAAERT